MLSTGTASMESVIGGVSILTAYDYITIFPANIDITKGVIGD